MSKFSSSIKYYYCLVLKTKAALTHTQVSFAFAHFVFLFRFQKAAHLEMEGLIDVKINTNANNHIVHRGSIAFKQRELLDANGKTILGRAFDLERIMNDIDAFISDYIRGNCKLADHRLDGTLNH